jgi:hypothetical protein
MEKSPLIEAYPQKITGSKRLAGQITARPSH